MSWQIPDLSIVGAPKCGTSSLHYWLSKLPGINAAEPKETFYFMDKDNPWLNPRYNYHQDGTEKFVKFFNRRKTGKTLDSTTHYYYQQTAMDLFSQSGTKVCLVLRDPAKRLLSYYQYVCLTRGAVTEEICFGEFTRHLLENDVSQYRDAFINEREFHSLQTSLQQGQYIDAIRGWLEQIQPENFRVLIFEDLIRQREEFLQSITDFFEVAADRQAIQNFRQENETVAIKFPRINRFAKSVARGLTNERIKKMLRGTYMKLQKKEKPDLTGQYQSEIRQLYEYYEPYNQALSELLDIDLSVWKMKSTASP